MNKPEMTVPAGRFAPSPTGRMHLGNIMTALVSWLSVKKAGGRWVLRIEDLDPQRSKHEWSRLIEEDLDRLGLTWDEGGLDDMGPHGPYSQSRRDEVYEAALQRLKSTGYTYPCVCTRADIMATQAPHQSDGRVIYRGTCRPEAMPFSGYNRLSDIPHATRLFVPDEEITFTDRVYGTRHSNLAHDCGDFILRRADGAWAYQLAVVVDDASMGVTEVVRGNDLLLSTAQQLYLYRLLGLKAPDFAHVPLVCNSDNRRLSKRDVSLNMGEMLRHDTPEAIIGRAAYLAGIRDTAAPCTPAELIDTFDWSLIPRQESVIVTQA